MASVEATQPADDVGADTAARYRYQAELIARIALAIIDGSIERVICEWHEDYVVFRVGADPELVSVKHLEPSQPRWTIRQLFQDGGVAHIFGRWRAVGENATCLIQTNSGLRTGSGNADDFRECCKDGAHASRASWVTTCMDELAQAGVDPPPNADEVVRFLDVLRFEDALPNKPDIRAINILELSQPVAARLGRAASDADGIYDVVVAVVEAASRNDGGPALLPWLADPSRFEPDAELMATLAAKTIDRDRLIRALEPPQPEPLVTLMQSDDEPTRMAMKMAQGGFGPTAINNARSQRLNWETHRRRWTGDLGERSPEFGGVQASVLDVAGEAEVAAQAASTGEPYGPEMLRLIKLALGSNAIPVPAAGPDLRLLLGCVWDLTEQCEIWWSPRFDLDEALAR